MTTNILQPIAPFEKIQILLAEYATLRDEVLQRDSSLNQFIVIGGATVVAIVAAVGTMAAYKISALWLGVSFVGLLGTDALLVFVGFKMVEFDVLRIAERLLELESAINELAGEQLLAWETTRGIALQGYRYRGRHVVLGLASLLTAGWWRPTQRLWFDKPGSDEHLDRAGQSNPAKRQRQRFWWAII